MFQNPEKKIKKISTQKRLQKNLLRGSERLYQIVGSTLGPFGRNVIVKQNKMKSFITKDGITVARNVSFGNTFQNMAAEIIKQAAESTVQVAGDGTTTSTLLAFHLFETALNELKHKPNLSRSEVQQEMLNAVKEIKDFLKEQAKPIGNLDEIENVAKISANGDASIAFLIRSAVEQIGKDGSISIQLTHSNQTSLEVSEGFRMEAGILARDLVTDANKQICKFSNCLVFITDQVISQTEVVQPILQLAVRDEKPLVIVASDVKDQALALLLITHLRKDHPICVVRAPRYGNERIDLLDDLALRVGATFFKEKSGKMIKTVKMEDFGHCEMFEATRSSSTFVSRKGKVELIDERMKALRERIQDRNIPIEEAKFLQERLTKLASGIAVIKVGGLTEAEVVEKSHRIEDALEAVNAARKGGILPGGGTALIRAQNHFFQTWESVGKSIVLNCLSAPLEKILMNKGEDQDAIRKIVDQVSSSNDFWFGFDARNPFFGNLWERGIVDPYLVVVSALENAASAAGILLTTDSAILEFEV